MRTILAVLILSIAAHAYTIVLTWTASTTTTVDHYSVYRALVSGGPYQLMGTVPSTQLTFTNGSNPDGTALVPGQLYCYVATAIAAGIASVYSNEVCVTIPVAPAPPTNLQGVP